ECQPRRLESLRPSRQIIDLVRSPLSQPLSTAAVRQRPKTMLRPAVAALVSLMITAVAPRLTGAGTVTFRVVSPDGVPSVSVSGGPARQMVQFVTNITESPYYTLEVPDAPAPPFTYRYSAGSAAEPFARTFAADGRASTYNDFFNRNGTLSKLPNLPLVFGSAWSRGWGRTPTFDDQYIPTIYFSGDQAAVNTMLTSESVIPANLTMMAIMKDEAFVYPAPIGFYLMTDSATSNSFLRAEFHGEPSYKQYTLYGSLVKAENPFLFMYNGPDRADYPEVSVHYLGRNPIAPPLQTLIERWIEPLAMTIPGSDASVDENLKPNVDLDTLIKSAAGKWFYISSNAEESFGVGLTTYHTTRDVISSSFRRYQYKKPRPVIQKLMEAPKYAAHMGYVLSELTKSLFNSNTLAARVQAQAARIRPEVAWDRSLARPSPGIADLYTIVDFDRGLTATAERPSRVVAVGSSENATIPGVGWGVLTWVSQKSSAVSAELGVQPSAAGAGGPDPVTTAPSVEQLKGHQSLLSGAPPRATTAGRLLAAACAVGGAVAAVSSEAVKNGAPVSRPATGADLISRQSLRLTMPERLFIELTVE
ncbi:MAG: hypothetical protein BJ554DRAFT_5489, partial [Olpidium bornovanus]